jgi:alpha-1,6-mannosyltransferase
MKMLKTNRRFLIAIAAFILLLILSIQLTLNGLEPIQPIPLGNFTRIINRRLMSFEFLTICILDLVWLYQTRKDTAVLKFTQILKSAAPFLTLSWLTYPGTRDIYLYLQYGLMSLNGVNPYLTKAGDFQSDVTSVLHWNVTSTYGIFSQFFFVLSAKLAEHSVILGVYGFKLICLAFHILNAYLIWRILQNSRWITFAYLLSPVLLFEQVAEAHLDVMLCTILIAIDQFLKHRKYLSALVMTGVGFLTKTVPIIWLPLIGVFLIRQKRWKTLTLFSVICAIAILVLSLTMFPSIAAWRSILNPGVSTQTAGSWHNLLAGMLERTRGGIPIDTQAVISDIFKKITMLVFAGYYGLTLLKIGRKSMLLESQLMVKIGWVTLVLFAVATPWYQPWYATILLPIAALNLHARSFVVTSFGFSMMGTIANFCLSYNQTRFGMIGSLLTMGSVVLLMRLKFADDSQVMQNERSHTPDRLLNLRK